MPAPEQPWYVRHYTERCGAEFAASPLQVATKGGPRLPIHNDIIAAVAQVPATASAIEQASGPPTPGASGSRAAAAQALSVVTSHYSTASVAAFLGQVYCLSGLLGDEAEEAAAAAWTALSAADRGAAVELADALHAPRVLDAWAHLAEVHSDLRLADAYQQQLPDAYAGCMEQAKMALADGGATASPVLALLPQLSERTAAALLTHYAAAADGKVAALAAEAEAERAKDRSMWPAIGLTVVLSLLLVAALTAGLVSEHRVRLAVTENLAAWQASHNGWVKAAHNASKQAAEASQALEGTVKLQLAETAGALESSKQQAQQADAHLAALHSLVGTAAALARAHPRSCSAGGWACSAGWPAQSGTALSSVHQLLQSHFQLLPGSVDGMLLVSGGLLHGDAMAHALRGWPASNFSGALNIIAPVSEQGAWEALLGRHGYRSLASWQQRLPPMPPVPPFDRAAVASIRAATVKGRTFSQGDALVQLGAHPHPLSVVMRSPLSAECVWYDGTALHSPFARHIRQGIALRGQHQLYLPALSKYKDVKTVAGWVWVAGWQPDGTPYFAVVPEEEEEELGDDDWE